MAVFPSMTLIQKPTIHHRRPPLFSVLDIHTILLTSLAVHETYRKVHTSVHLTCDQNALIMDCELNHYHAIVIIVTLRANEVNS